MKIYTIGFTKKNAEQFFGQLKIAGVRKVIDTRLNNVSQLAGFTKKDDLRFFVKEILGVEYVQMPLMAPTKDILDPYKKGSSDWNTYERQYTDLISSRHIEDRLDRDALNGACLLCSEPTPHHCHRRLAAEYLQDKWGNIEIQHL